MLTLLPHTLALLPALTASAAMGNASPSESAWLKAISDQFVVVDMKEGDLNGDGLPDTALCYQVSPDDPEQGGGIAILHNHRGTLRPGYHVLLDRAWCDEVKLDGGALQMTLKSRLLQAKAKKLVWTYGSDFVFPGDKKHPLYDAQPSASSSLRQDTLTLEAQNAFDGDIDTAWAEAKEGTGIGQSLSVKFAHPLDIAYVGVFPGRGGGKRAFFDANRLHRGSLEARTREDLGDDVAGIDFSELGIDVGGDRVEFSLENRPAVQYVRVNKSRVEELELRIDSVYLGDRYDDTHIAEVEVVHLLRLSDTLDRAEPLAQSVSSAATESEVAKASASAQRFEERREEARARFQQSEHALDAEATGLIPDDF